MFRRPTRVALSIGANFRARLTLTEAVQIADALIDAVERIPGTAK